MQQKRLWFVLMAVVMLTWPGRAISQTYYLALGDSLAQGEQPLPGGGKEIYHGYAEDLAPMINLHLVNFGCGGETTSTMIQGGACIYSQGSQLAAAEDFIRTHTVGLVTIDIGADDYNSCSTSSGYDLGCLTTKTLEVVTNLAAILDGLRCAGGPELRIVAINYYDPYLSFWANPVLGPVEATATLSAIEAFNAAELTEYALFGVPVADVANAFRSGDVLPEAYNGQLVPTNVVEICQLTWMCSEGNIHANDAGYALIAQTLYPLTQKSAM